MSEAAEWLTFKTPSGINGNIVRYRFARRAYSIVVSKVIYGLIFLVEDKG